MAARVRPASPLKKEARWAHEACTLVRGALVAQRHRTILQQAGRAQDLSAKHRGSRLGRAVGLGALGRRPRRPLRVGPGRQLRLSLSVASTPAGVQLSER